MKVRELMEELNAMDPDMEVHMAYNYGDHWRTVVAPSVSGVEETLVEYSEYHSMDRVVDPREDESEDDVETEAVESEGGARRRMVAVLRT